MLFCKIRQLVYNECCCSFNSVILCSTRLILEIQDMKTCRMTRLDSLHDLVISRAHPALTRHLNFATQLLCDCFSFEIFSIKLCTWKRFADHHLLLFADHHLLKASISLSHKKRTPSIRLYALIANTRLWLLMNPGKLRIILPIAMTVNKLPALNQMSERDLQGMIRTVLRYLHGRLIHAMLKTQLQGLSVSLCDVACCVF